MNEFNFNKIDEREILLTKDFCGFPVSFLINNSPLTKFHLLIVPDSGANFPQIMNENCLRLAIEIMMSTKDGAVRLGFNSPGALASVNHLHLHLIYVERTLFVDKVVKFIIYKIESIYLGTLTFFFRN